MYSINCYNKLLQRAKNVLAVLTIRGKCFDSRFESSLGNNYKNKRKNERIKPAFSSDSSSRHGQR